MRTLKHISALLAVASILLSSCSLLESSPLPHSRPRPHYPAPESFSYGSYPYRHNKVYNGVIHVPAEGGVYEFKCGDDKLFISEIYDSSMPLPDRQMNSHYSPTSNDYISVDDVSYSGSFYTITCNKDQHNWVVKVDPLLAASGELANRDVWVIIWDLSDDSNFLFQFEQSESLEYLQ